MVKSLYKMKKQGQIDSMNFGSFDFEHLFDSDDYIIETVKSIGIFKPKRWSETFGKPITKNNIEAKIVHTSMGLTLALKRYASAKDVQVLEFAGLYGYDEKSRILRSLLIELLPKLSEDYLKRIDICFDYPTRIPNRIIKTICQSGRVPFPFKNTIYYKTPSENKTNSVMDLKVYDKQIESNLPYPMKRLEFVFKGKYLNKLKLKDIDKIYPKMIKSIDKFSGINAQIIPIS